VIASESQGLWGL